MSPKKKYGGPRMVFALLAGIFLLAKAGAQPAGPVAENRWLFIFDTSADMKQRLPAVRKEVNSLLATSMGSQMRDGDGIGVWTFDQDLRTGQFPLLPWTPNDAESIASRLNKFVSGQRYAKTTRFNALQPLLDRVIRNSDRLTVLIFCDGKDAISGTPYDSGINQVFQQRVAEQKRIRQPFVIVLRTQRGQYVGCSANFPPGMVNFPEFPPFAPPPPPAPTNAPPPPSPRPQIGPPLIIIGTNVETRWPPEPVPATRTNTVPALQTNVVNAPPQTGPPLIGAVTNVETRRPPESAPATRTNAVPAPPINAITPTNALVAMRTNFVTASPANAVAPPENSDPDRLGALALGAGFLMAAVALAALAIVRARKTDRSSLISRSMKKR